MWFLSISVEQKYIACGGDLTVNDRTFSSLSLLSNVQCPVPASRGRRDVSEAFAERLVAATCSRSVSAVPPVSLLVQGEWCYVLECMLNSVKQAEWVTELIRKVHLCLCAVTGLLSEHVNHVLYVEQKAV